MRDHPRRGVFYPGAAACSSTRLMYLAVSARPTTYDRIVWCGEDRHRRCEARGERRRPQRRRSLDERADQPVLLSYPNPPLTDGAVVLRRWAESDMGCVEEASREGRIPEGTTVPENVTVAEGLAGIERQWARADNGTGLSQA